MSISSELSSEIATAILAASKGCPRELQKMKEVVLAIHLTLQQLTIDERLTKDESSTTDDAQSRSNRRVKARLA